MSFYDEIEDLTVDDEDFIDPYKEDIEEVEEVIEEVIEEETDYSVDDLVDATKIEEISDTVEETVEETSQPNTKESGKGTETEDFEQEEKAVVMDKLKVDLPKGFSLEDDDDETSKKGNLKVSSSNDKGKKKAIQLDDGEEVVSPEERLRSFSDEILSCMVGEKEILDHARRKLLKVTSPELFRDENYVLFYVMFRLRDKLKGITMDDEFLKLYLTRNKKLLDESRLYIDIHAYGELEGSEDLAYIAGVVKHFKRLCGMPNKTEEEFDLLFEKYLIEFKAIEASKAYAKGNLILTEGIKVGKKKYHGFEDSQIFVKKRLAEIEGLVDMNIGSGFITMKDLVLSQKESNRKTYKIGDFDKVEALNESYGGIYTGLFYSVIAGPKMGKSKFCARLAHTALVKYGTNVSVWAQEGGSEAWGAQMRAIHFDYTYNQGADIKDRKLGVDQDTILFDKFKTDELRKLESYSTLDFVTNSDYGTLAYINRPFNVETFLEDIDTSIKDNKSQMLIIDYLQLMGSATNKPERERISDAYKRVLVYCKQNNIAVISPAQYKQSVIDNLSSMTSTEGVEMRTAGGGTSEVVKTPDVLLSFWASTQDLLNNSLKILSMPGRFCGPIPEISCYIDLGTCNFVSLRDD